MSITVECTCGKKLKAKDEAAGRSAKCPACGSLVTFPALEEAVLGEENPFANPLWERPDEPEPTPPAPPPLPKAEWHFGRDGDRQGPVAFHAIQQLVAAGELKPSDMVWKEGMPDWVPVATVPDLLASPAKPARPLKPIAAVVAALAVVGLVAALLIARPWHKEPMYGDKPLSEWAELLKDSNPNTQREAVEALGSIGLESHPHIPEMMNMLNKTDDADTMIAIVNSLEQILLSTNGVSEEKRDLAVAAMKELEDNLPGILSFRDRVTNMRDQTRANLSVARRGSGTHDADVSLIQEESKWEKIFEGVRKKIMHLEYRLAN